MMPTLSSLVLLEVVIITTDTATSNNKVGIITTHFSMWADFVYAFMLHFSDKKTTFNHCIHYSYVIMGAMASQIISPLIVYSTVSSGPDQGKHQSSVSLAFVRGIHQWPVNSPHKGPVTRKSFHLMKSFIMIFLSIHSWTMLSAWSRVQANCCSRCG